MRESETVPRSSASGRVAGSYRDPSGYVFLREGRIFRAVDENCAKTIRRLAEKGLLQRLIERGFIVETSFVTEPRLLAALQQEHAGYRHFLEHRRIEEVTYPYEWTVSMLADAAVLTLDLEIELLEAGFSLKDATAFNIQFIGAKPVFIDIPSIEVPARLDLWYALGQFNRMFLFPLLMARYRGWDLRSYFLGNLGGRDVDFVANAFGRLGRWRPGLWLDVTFPWLLGRMAEKKPSQAPVKNPSQPSVNREPLLFNLRRLRKKILRLAQSYKPQGLWTSYTNICNYDRSAEEGKRGFVTEKLTQARCRHVLDMGCNTGEYSLAAAETGARVTAVDQDHDSVEVLYRNLRTTSKSILPLTLDITNPSPAVGFRNTERTTFAERIRPDCVLALALLHHLLVSGNLSLDATCDLFADLTEDYLLLEFVPPDDDMFQRLTRFRDNLYTDMTLADCRRTYAARFDILEEFPVPDSKRVLLWMRKRR
ncbi:nodulation protein NoeA [Thermostilla marina]